MKTYEEIRKSILEIPPKRRVHDVDYDIIKELYPESTYKKSLIINWIVLNDKHIALPLSYCKSEPKCEKGKIKLTCENFSLKDRNSCSVCYDRYFKEKAELNKSGNIKKYGVDNPMKNKEIKDKVKKTNIERYGVEWALSNKDVQSKVQLVRNEQKINTRKEIVAESIKGKYTLISDITTGDYLNVHQFMCHECDSIFDFKFSNNYECIRCTKCHPVVNTGEEELCSYLDFNKIKYTRRLRILDGKEIDIFLPEYNIGIEYNGIYWHSSLFLDKNYHQDKTLLAHKKGIRLIHIFEDDFKNNKELIFKRLDSLLLKNKSLYARKCIISEISQNDCNTFLEKYHAQGSVNSSIKLGAFYNEQLVAVMTFGKSRYTEKYEYELYRFCSNGVVVGIASKLLKYFEKKYNPKSIHTYAEMDWGMGNVYYKLGFEYLGITKPNYFYYDKTENKRYSRQQCQKKKLIEKFGFQPTLTEKQMTEKLGYLRIYNSGNVQFFKKYH